MTILGTSYVVLWLMVLILTLGFLALARQIGVLYGRLPQVGARIENTGPKIGDRISAVALPGLDGSLVQIPSAQRPLTLLVFINASCSVCRAIAPAVRGLAATEHSVAVTLVSFAGDLEETRVHDESLGLSEIPHVLSLAFAKQVAVLSTPYALVLNSQGIVQAKGLVQNREQLDSLLTALDMKVESLQVYAERYVLPA
jgi:methylamine dehydrogenase accessory protein MauD